MKIRNTLTCFLHADLKNVLEKIRDCRNFNSRLYIQSKVHLLNQYLLKHNLKSCIIALSGGIDSAVVLGIIKEASKQPNSPIERICAVQMPVFHSNGASNQETAMRRGNLVCKHFGITSILLDLSDIQALAKEKIDTSSALALCGDSWAAGQLVSYIRTPALYYLSSLLHQIELPAVICGTTNLDEGGYLGYFGKAADGMVDLQMISDIHKSEVFKIANLFEIPEEVMLAPPNGDLFDGKTDEEVIGAPYDFVEIYLNYLLWDVKKREMFHSGLQDRAQAQFNLLAENLEKMHAYNQHKYLGKSPAIHLDVFRCKIPGGWDHAPTEQPTTPATKDPVALFQISPEFFLEKKKALSADNPHFFSTYLNESVFQVASLLSQSECDLLIEELKRHAWVEACQNGFYTKDVVKPLGSYRASTFQQEFADLFWERLSPFCPSLKIVGEQSHLDLESHGIWRAIGINPLLRFIIYPVEGILFPHYDASYIPNKSIRTLTSVIIYLTETTDPLSGQTRFIRDPQLNLPKSQRCYEDWTSPAHDQEILLSISPSRGNALFFDHRMLHESSRMMWNDYKIVLRTDILYERCDSIFHK
jgi:NAD+ synthetase